MRAETRPRRAALLCRYGEVFLKQGNRARFEQKLVRNVRAMLSDLPGVEIEKPHGRILVWVPEDILEEAHARVLRVFGLVSVSRARCPDRELGAIVQTAVDCAQAAVQRAPAFGRSFKIEARRSDKSFPHRSHDMAVVAGRRIAETLGIPVDVHRPAMTVGIEIAARHVFVFADTAAAPGGLPVGTAGRALLLLSGGIDSPVAGWLAAKRGLEVHAIYFHSPPFVGEKTRDKVLDLGRQLARWHALESLTTITFTDIQKKLRDHGRADLAVVLYRRMMMRIADRIADDLRCDALVTGENLSQVASQTVQNLATIEAAARHLVLRPLITYDKVETIRLAENIGTFATSTLPYDDCCALFQARHPATTATRAAAQASEEGLDLEAEAAAAAATAKRIELGSRAAKPT